LIRAPGAAAAAAETDGAEEEYEEGEEEEKLRVRRVMPARPSGWPCRAAESPRL